eukprot:3760046-Pleurochrysis_carterae.AAC.2
MSACINYDDAGQDAWIRKISDTLDTKKQSATRDMSRLYQSNHIGPIKMIVQAELAHRPAVAVELGAEGLDQAGRDSVQRAERCEQTLVEQRRCGGRGDALEEPRRVAACLNAVDNDGARGGVRIVRTSENSALDLRHGGSLASLLRLGRNREAHADGGVLCEHVGLELAMRIDETQVVIRRELERLLGVEGEADVRRGVVACVALEVDGLKPILRLHLVSDADLKTRTCIVRRRVSLE